MKALLPILSLALSGRPESIVVFRENFAATGMLSAYRVVGEVNEGVVQALRGQRGWHLVLDRGGDADCRFEGSEAHVAIKAAGDIWYSVQLCYMPLPLEKGKTYKATFEAKADANRSMTLDIAFVGGDWLSYSGRIKYGITRRWQSYTCIFQVTSPSNPAARFEFNIGNEPANITFRNLRIVEQ